MLKSVIAAVTVAAALGMAAAPAEAGDNPTVVRGPVVCHPARCTQHRTVTITRHGSLPEVLVEVRHRAVESRSPYSDREAPPWSRWRTVSVS